MPGPSGLKSSYCSPECDRPAVLGSVKTQIRQPLPQASLLTGFWMSIAPCVSSSHFPIQRVQLRCLLYKQRRGSSSRPRLSADL
jgi:hypothetical protein